MRHTEGPTSRFAVLRAIPLFHDCTDRQLGNVEALVDDVDAYTGEILTREGRYEPQSFIIVSGEAIVTRAGELLATLSSGDFFGEMAVLDRSSRSATVTAATNMHLLVLDPRSFMSLLEVASVARIMLQGLVSRLRAADEAAVPVR